MLANISCQITRGCDFILRCETGGLFDLLLIKKILLCKVSGAQRDFWICVAVWCSGQLVR